MMRFSFALLFTLWTGLLSGQITLIVNQLPSTTPSGAVVYVAGNFNGWNPGSTPMIPDGQGRWVYTVPAGTGTLEYKFTRGAWATVEGSASGGFRPNRTYVFGNGDTVLLQIAGWEGLGGGNPSTANAQVQIYQTAFPMPQLNRTRRIWVYLPLAYTDTTRRFPVLYMHDAQNLFDESTAAFGTEWRVDETLLQLEQAGDSGIIVVGIDNGPNRIGEYSPWVNAQNGGGDGEKYIDFIAHTLKPHIDSVFRTRTDAAHTGIAGSSMGGLISLYGALRYPAVFSKAGVMSPSLWFSDSVYRHAGQATYMPGARMYLLAGGQEPASVANNNRRMTDTLAAIGYPATARWNRTVTDGQHSEWFWAREFADMYQKLFAPDAATSIYPEALGRIRFYPTPGRDRLVLELPSPARVSLLDSAGRSLITRDLGSGSHELALPTLPAGLYLLRFEAGGLVRVEKWVVE